VLVNIVQVVVQFFIAWVFALVCAVIEHHKPFVFRAEADEGDA
jgi:hypothetical protein